MALPKLDTPIHTLVLPSTGQEIKYRPFLVKEQKLLMMAQESEEDDQMYHIMWNIVRACTFDKVDADTVPLFDIEWLFLQLRSKSVSEVIELRFKHTEKEDCNHSNDIEINIEDIKVHYDKEHSNKIPLENGIGLEMYYPSLGVAAAFSKTQFTVDDVFEMIVDSVKTVYDAEKVYNDFTRDELVKFLENLNQSHLEKFMKFFETMPKVKHTVKFKCQKCGEELSYDLEGLMDFFS